MTDIGQEPGVAMDGVRGGDDGGFLPRLHQDDGGRWQVRCYNEGNYNSTDLDVRDLIFWLRTHKPELMG